MCICMYVCVYVCMCVCVYVYMYVFMCVYMYVCVCVCVQSHPPDPFLRGGAYQLEIISAPYEIVWYNAYTFLSRELLNLAIVNCVFNCFTRSVNQIQLSSRSHALLKLSYIVQLFHFMKFTAIVYLIHMYGLQQ